MAHMGMPYRECRFICGCIWLYLGSSRGVTGMFLWVSPGWPKASRRYKIRTGITWYTPDIYIMHLRYIPETTQDTPCIHPIFTLDTLGVNREIKGHQPCPPPECINGLPRDVSGVYLECIWGVYSEFVVNPGCIQSTGMYPMYIQPRIIIIWSLGIVPRLQLLVRQWR